MSRRGLELAACYCNSFGPGCLISNRQTARVRVSGLFARGMPCDDAVNGNIEAVLRRGRGYKNIRYLLLKAQRLTSLKTEFLVLRKVG